jgi:pyruvate formate lyase activating enzyme
VHDGPGIRTTVFTKGCPLRCLWCHSPESQRLEDELSFLPVEMPRHGALRGRLPFRLPEGRDLEAPAGKEPPDGSLLTKVQIDRGLCDNCLQCTAVCLGRALWPTGREITAEEAYRRVEKDRFFFRDGGGATISGGEPMLQFDFNALPGEEAARGRHPRLPGHHRFDPARALFGDPALCGPVPV